MLNARPVSFASIAIGLIALAGVGLILKAFVFRSSGVSLQEIGSVVSVKGEATQRLPRSVAVDPLGGGTAYIAEQQITTRKGSEVVIVLRQGTKLKIGENTRFVAENDALKSRGSFVATILEGEVTVMDPGKAGTFRMLRQGVEVYPTGMKTGASMPVLPAVPGPQATPGSDTDQGIVISATTMDETATPIPVPTAVDPKTASQAETSEVLTNDDILKRVRSQAGLFQRCYLNLVQRNREAKKTSDAATAGGTVVLSFTIQSNGKVASGSRIVRSAFEDTTFNKCIAEVVERTTFRSFKGDPIAIAEFPITVR